LIANEANWSAVLVLAEEPALSPDPRRRHVELARQANPGGSASLLRLAASRRIRRCEIVARDCQSSRHKDLPESFPIQRESRKREFAKVS